MIFFRILRKRLILWILKIFRKQEARRLSPLIPFISIEYVGKNALSSGKALFIETLAKKLEKEGLKINVCIEGGSSKQTILLSNETKKNPDIAAEDFLISRRISTWMYRNLVNCLRAASDSSADLALIKGRVSAEFSPLFSIAVIDGEHVSDISLNSVFHKIAQTDALVILGEYEAKDIHRTLLSLQTKVYHSYWNLHIDPDLKHIKMLGFSGLNCAGIFYKLLLRHCSAIVGFVPLLSKYKHLDNVIRIPNPQRAQLVTTDQDFEFLSKKTKKQTRACELALTVDDDLISNILQVYRYETTEINVSESNSLQIHAAST